MSVKLKFQGESVQGSADGAVEMIYVIDGALTREAALEQLLSSPDCPATVSHSSYGTLYREKIPQIDEVNAELGFWLGTARWVPSDLSGQDQFEPVVSFNTTGGSAHIMVSKERLQANIDGTAFDAVPDFGNCIGATEGGGADGTDIIVPVYEWEETHEFSEEEVTQEYRRNLFRLTGTVCKDPFRDFAVGEALFMGASGSKRGRGSRPWEIGFKFAGSANATGIEIGDVPPIDKRGWDYLWVYFVTEAKEDAKILGPKPGAVFIERVYNYVSWTALNIDPPAP